MSSEFVREVVVEFVKAAIGSAATLVTGDAQNGNIQQERAFELARQLRNSKSGRASLVALIADKDVGVRYMAAMAVLHFAPEQGERALTDIIQGPPSPLRLAAQVSLTQWRSDPTTFLSWQ